MQAIRKNTTLPARSKRGGRTRAKSFVTEITADIKRHFCIYLLALPVIAFYILFHYIPMYGALIAFQDYIPAKGMLESAWVGAKHFISFFQDPYFFRILKNTLSISLLSILFGFPAPIIFALLLNEVRSSAFKRTVQTLTYLPHFISTMVICGMIATFVGRNGFINDIIAALGGERSNLLARPEMFRPVYILSDIWQGIGWGSIIYLSALAGIDPELYEAAEMDGASKIKQIWHVTLPCILPTIVIMLILRMGSLLSVGYEKIILLYNSMTYETADVISSYVYRRGLQEANYSYSAAVGLFNSFVNFFVIFVSNSISRRVGETSLW